MNIVLKCLKLDEYVKSMHKLTPKLPKLTTDFVFLHTKYSSFLRALSRMPVEECLFDVDLQRALSKIKELEQFSVEECRYLIISTIKELIAYPDYVMERGRIRISSGCKFGDIFKSLAGLNMDIEELDLPVRVYNLLKRNDIHTLEQLLTKSENELKRIAQIRPRPGYMDDIQYILIPKLEELAESQISSE